MARLDSPGADRVVSGDAGHTGASVIEGETALEPIGSEGEERGARGRFQEAVLAPGDGDEDSSLPGHRMKPLRRRRQG